MLKDEIAASELILNPDGSVYHLNLLPEDISNTIITVGDQDRVSKISSYFDSIEVKKGKREFACHTGTFQGKKISVISTGIGTDNIDIVFNELDALVNIDLKTRKVKEHHTKLNIIRVGTSGCLDGEIPLDSILLSSFGLGMDGLLNYYGYDSSNEITDMLLELNFHTNFEREIGIKPYLFKASDDLMNHFSDNSTFKGITTTCAGFYGPQGRKLRLSTKLDDLLGQLQGLKMRDHTCTNFEMETAGIYGMANLLGHHALSVNVIIANRVKGTFSDDPGIAVEKGIEWALKKIVML